MRFDSLDASGNAQPGHQYIVFKQNTVQSLWNNFGIAYGLGKDRLPEINPNGDVLYFNVIGPDGTMVEVDSISTVTTGAWYHVAGVRGPDYLQLYVNGQLEAQTNVSFAQDYAGNWPVYFGSTGQSFWDGKLKGALDEVSLYNRALSSNEVAAIYAAGAQGKCKTPIGPSITAQPQSQAVSAGQNATFTVGAGGTAPLSYQWQFNSVNVGGATGSSYSVINAQAANAGSYSVVVTNAAGSVTSPAATLTVVLGPQFTAVTLLPDRTPLLSLSAVSNLTYRIDGSTDLLNWTTLTNVYNSSGIFQVSDPNAASFSLRFYRAAWVP